MHALSVRSKPVVATEPRHSSWRSARLDGDYKLDIDPYYLLMPALPPACVAAADRLTVRRTIDPNLP